MYKIFNDNRNYQSFMIDNEDYLDLLDPHIGESKAMRLGIFNIPVKGFWEKLQVELFQNEGTVDLPDISEWKTGMIIMNNRAYKYLHKTLEPFGEFLPCSVFGETGYLFHCLNIREFDDSEVHYRFYKESIIDIDYLSFPSKFNDSVVTGVNKDCTNVFFSKEVITLIEENRIKGLVYTESLEKNSAY